MICCLCLAYSSTYLDVSTDKGAGTEQLCAIISKHFWIQPSLSDSICEHCWKQVDIFHSFYSNIQDIHTIATGCEADQPVDHNQSNNDTTIAKPGVEQPEKFVDDSNNAKDSQARNSKRKLQIDSAEIEQTNKNKQTKKSEYTRISEQADSKVSSYMKLSCDVCSFQVENFAEIKAHFRNEHQQTGYVICCNKKFYKRFYLIDHIDRHLNPNCFKCPHCDKVLVNNLGLRKHILTIHQTEKTFTCDECTKSFTSENCLKRHKLIHIPTELRKWKCKDCDKSFPSSFLLKAHHKRNHDLTTANICHICGKVYRRNQDFKTHQQTHSGITKPKAQCEKCGVWSKNSQLLRVHMRMIHSTANENFNGHQCNICDKILMTKRALKSHRHYSHALTEKYKCTVCEKTFKRAISLKEHLTIHTGEVLYNCSHCSKTFKSNANYHHHRKKEHRSEWEDERKKRGLPSIQN